MCKRERTRKESLGKGERGVERLGEKGRVAVEAPSLEFFHGRERKGGSGERGERKNVPDWATWHSPTGHLNIFSKFEFCPPPPLTFPKFEIFLKVSLHFSP